jgi:hypothetical protein
MDLLDTTPVSASDIPKIAAVHVGFFIFFWITYFVSAAVMGAMKSNKIYQELSPEKKADYLSRIVANIHAVFSTLVGYMTLFHTW